MNINIKKNLLFFFALAIVISAHASRTLRTDNLTPPAEAINSESENYVQKVPARIKRNDSSSSLKIENNPLFIKHNSTTHQSPLSESNSSKENRAYRLSSKINSEQKSQNRIFRISTFSTKNNKLIKKEKVTRVREKKLVSVQNNILTNKPFGVQMPYFNASSGEWVQYFFDGFEGPFPGSWEIYGTPTWGPTDTESSTGSKSAWCAGYDYTPSGNYFDNMDAWIIRGPFDLSASENALLFFDFTIKSQPEVDELFVGLSTDNDNFTGDIYTGDSGGWISNVYFDAKDFAHSNSVYIGVQFCSNETISNYAGAFIDNIELMGYQTDSNTAPDLAVQNVHITDSYAGKFNFEIKNNSAQKQSPDSYYISVFVDNTLDSQKRNVNELPSGATTIWDWQLAYYYLPGEHNVEILIEPDGGNVNTNDNSIFFTLIVTNKNIIDLGVSNPLNVDPSLGYFDFDIDNFGPAIALTDSYLITVTVDGEFDSSARNTEPLYPDQYTTWEWATDYIYSAGDHTVEITVESDLTDTNLFNNTATFIMPVPSNLIVTDLKVSNLKITDEKNAVFKFKIKNKGPKICEKNDYSIKIYVDDVEDSSSSNSKTLGIGVTAIWEWQLNYKYPPGLHKIKIVALPSGGDLKPEDNTLLFQMVESGANLQVYNIPTFTSIVENSFSTMLTATNGSPPYSWELSSGTLPPEIYLAGNGKLYGNPTTSGNYSFKVKCYDSSSASVPSDVTIIVLDSPPAMPRIIDTILPITFENTFFQTPLYAVGGTQPYSWSFNGSTLPGISISPTGSISGTITFPGNHQISVKVTDIASSTAETELNLRVLATSQSINYQITKLQIVIPWKEHSIGNNNSDSIKFKAEFPIPSELVIDDHTKLTIFIGDYPFSFIKPSKAKLNKKVNYKTEKGAIQKGNANIKWQKDKIKVNLSMKNVDLAAPLKKFGLKENTAAILTIPIRISINDCDSGSGN